MYIPTKSEIVYLGFSYLIIKKSVRIFFTPSELLNRYNDREKWRERFRDIRASSTT